MVLKKFDLTTTLNQLVLTCHTLPKLVRVVDMNHAETKGYVQERSVSDKQLYKNLTCK